MASPPAAYVHVPFCVHRCGYCDFTVVAGRDDLSGRYVTAVGQELRGLATAAVPIDTLFIGGGTPTHLPLKELEHLLTRLRENFELGPESEFTVEANPRGLTDEKLNILQAFGVTRISLGVQSLETHVLRTLERDHTPIEALERLTKCQDMFPQVSADLIFGVPGLTADQWRSSLQRMIRQGIRHISCYGLTFEKGTAFWTRRMKGLLPEMSDEFQRGQYSDAMDILPGAGLEQYELSNFAAGGHRCRHNEHYWDRGEYYGIGPGAASLVHGVRRTNHRSTTTWLRRIEAEENGVAEVEPETPETVAEELIMLGLRRAEGLCRQKFERRTGLSLEEVVPGAVTECEASGWIEQTGDCVRLTREGRFVADTVLEIFFTAFGGRSATA